MVLFQRTKDPRADEQADRFHQISEKLDKSKLELFRSVQVQPQPGGGLAMSLDQRKREQESAPADSPQSFS